MHTHARVHTHAHPPTRAHTGLACRSCFALFITLCSLPVPAHREEDVGAGGGAQAGLLVGRGGGWVPLQGPLPGPPPFPGKEGPVSPSRWMSPPGPRWPPTNGANSAISDADTGLAFRPRHSAVGEPGRPFHLGSYPGERPPSPPASSSGTFPRGRPHLGLSLTLCWLFTHTGCQGASAGSSPHLLCRDPRLLGGTGPGCREVAAASPAGRGLNPPLQSALSRKLTVISVCSSQGRERGSLICSVSSLAALLPGRSQAQIHAVVLRSGTFPL